MIVLNILLLEPNYKNKYPPLGLMKIAAFHKNLGDEVIFSKGDNKNFKDYNFERIYINSLFTFEWPATKKMIDFALKLTKNHEKIYLGGIAATLLPNEITREYPTINIVQGLLNEPNKLGLLGDETIDTLPPDYSILEQIEYKYPTNDAYFSYATRGCGMNCSFCAVQRLEPEYVNYICIKDQINNVIKQCGTKRNLMLMDNNVLKSPNLEKIVEDVIDLGFGKGAKYKNPHTNKLVKRHVDFNQGLDANFLSAEKACLLAKLELNPVRIAFDHISQKDKYAKAIRICFDAGLRSFSNYLLYNTNAASWKGEEYGADTPENLYNRLKFNVDLCESFNEELRAKNSGEKAYIYSFPMRYIPLGDMKRGYIGDNWDKKALRAIQVFITPTQGKGVSSKTFFEASFGKTVEEFRIALYTPENILIRRGQFKLSKKDKQDPQAVLRKTKKYNFNMKLLNEWNQVLLKVRESGLWDHFIDNYVKNNVFSFEVYKCIDNDLEKKLFLYYLGNKYFRNYVGSLKDSEKIFINNFLNTEGVALEIYFNEKNDE